MQQAMIDVGGMRPSSISALLGEGPAFWWQISALSVVTSLFIHASWLHLLGNLVYLWVFGIKVEQRLGWVGMILLFLLGGALANVIVALRVPQLDTPIIGWAENRAVPAAGFVFAICPRSRATGHWFLVYAAVALHGIWPH